MKIMFFLLLCIPVFCLSFWKTPLQLVQEKIDFWGKRETDRQEDFKAIKKVLKEAMNSSSIGKGEVSYFFNHSLRLFKK
jgi:hypothetical protein